MQTLGTLANAADTTNLNYLNNMFNTAGNVQGAEQQRLNSMLDQLYRENALQAGLTGGFYQNGGQFSGDAATAGINAGANAAQLAGQGQNVQGGFPLQIGQTFIAGKKAGAF